MFNWKFHYKWPFSIAMLNYQRVPCLWQVQKHFRWWTSHGFDECLLGQNSTFFVWIISARPVGPSIWWNEEVIFTELQNLVFDHPLYSIGHSGRSRDTHIVRHAAWVCSFWGCLRFRPTAIMGYDPVVGWFEVTIDTHKWHWHLDVDGCSWISFSDQFEEWLTWGPSYPLVICNIAIEHCYL